MSAHGKRMTGSWEWLVLFLLFAGPSAAQEVVNPQVEIDPRFGSASVTLPLPELPSRNGLDPNLALVYQQSLTDEGQGFGLGWGLTTSSLRVDHEFGTPHPYYNMTLDAKTKDTFYQLSLDGQPLRYVAQRNGAVEYSTESFESKVQILRYDAPFKIQLRDAEGRLETRDISSGFEVRAADGSRRIYSGDSTVAEAYFYQTAPTIPEIQRKFVSRWPLVYEIRPGGDAIEYRYLQDQGRSYLKEVVFASQRSRYVFHLDAAPTGPVSFAATFRQEARLYYKGVVACLDDQPQNTWLFSYSRFPVQSFAALSCNEAQSRRLEVEPNPASLLAEGANVDPGLATRAWRALSQWFSELFSSESERNTEKADSLYLARIYRFGQKVGDPTDVTIARDSTVQISYKTWQTPAGDAVVSFSQDAPGPLTGLGYQNNGELLDANQDGLPDLVVHDKAKGVNRVFYNQGFAQQDAPFVEGPALTIKRKTSTGSQTVVPLLNDSATRNGFLHSDLNGDGWDDLIEIAGDGTWTVFFSRRPMGGEGFESTTAKAKLESNGQLIDLKVDSSFFTNGRGYLRDLNGDGRPDILYPALGTDGNAQFQAYMNTSKRGSDQISFVSRTFKYPFATSATGTLAQPEYRFIDMNRDGLIDLVKIVALATGTKGLCLFENQGLTGITGSYLFRQDKPAAGLTCESQYFYRIDDLEIEQSLTETINGMLLLDLDSNGVLDFARINDKSHELEFWLGKASEKGFAKKQTMTIPQSISLSKNKYDTLSMDVDQDGYDEIVTWNATTKNLQIIDLNRKGEGQDLGTGLLSQVSVETGSMQALEFTSYAALRQARKDPSGSALMRPLPVAMTIAQQRVTQSRDFTAAADVFAITSFAEYNYEDARWDNERNSFLGFDKVKIFRPGSVLSGRVVADAQMDTFDYALGLTSLDQHRYLGALVKKSETIELPWDSAKEDSLRQHVQVDPAHTRTVLSLFESIYGSSAQTGLSLIMQNKTYSLRPLQPEVPATTPSRAAHIRPRYFIKNDLQEELQCSGLEASCSEARMVRTSRTYDEVQFRLAKEQLDMNEIQGPREQTLSARSLETSLEYDVTSTQSGILTNISQRTVKSLGSGRTVAFYEAVYHPVWGKPIRETESTYVFEDDRAQLPEALAQLIPTETTRTLITNYDADDAGFGMITSIQDDLGLIESYSYGPGSLFRIATKNAKEHTSHACYSDKDCLVLDRKPKAGASRYPLLTQTPQGYWAEMERDALGRPLKVISALGEEQTFRYEQGSVQRPSLQEVRLFDASLKSIVQRKSDLLDAEGRLLAQVIDRDQEPAWVNARIAFDRAGQKVWQTSPYQVSSSYDVVLAQSSEIFQHAGPASWQMFDGTGRLKSQSSVGEAETTSFQYPAWGRIETITGKEGSRTRQIVARDLQSPDALIDEEEHLHLYKRNELGMLREMRTEDDKKPRSYVHDSQGRLLASVIPGVQTQVMERDARGRVTRIHSLGFDGKQQRTIEQTHDSLNRMTHVIDRSAAAPQLLTELYYDQITDPEGTLHEMAGALLGSRTYDAKAKLDTFDVFQRDLKNRVVLEKTLYLKTDGTIAQRSEEARTWRADDQEVQLQINGELTVNYEYERAGGLKEVRASLPGMETWKVFSEAHWAPHRQITRARLAQGAIGSAWGYDENYLWNEARDVCLAGSGSSVDNACATGESLENESLERYSNGYVQSRNDSHTYTYSKRGELTGARQPRLHEQWNYTAASHFQNFDGQSVQASGRSPLLPATGAERTLELDEWGRVTEFAGVRGFYNAEDRLVRTEKGRESIEYGYHAHGLRSFKRMRSAEGQESTLYFPNTHLTLGTQRQVTLQLPGQLVAQIDLNRKSMSLILTDGVGTPLKRFDAEGQLIESWERGAFGQLIQHHAAADGSTTLLSFGGHNEDVETGWIHMGQRIYIPSLGHFATPDPLFLADPERCISGSWQECELYTYVANNPVNSNDPDGLTKGSGSTSPSSKPSHGSSSSSSKTSKPSKPSPTKQVPKALPALKGPGDYHIFRTGNNNATALTPRPQDHTGLSFTMVRPEGKSFHVTTIVTVNGTGHLTAVNDHGKHVSVSAAAGHEAMASWIASRPTATTNPHQLTVVLMSITEFHR